jgi:hypothetical protein
VQKVFVRGRWHGRKPHLRRFASLALLHACICTSAPAKLTNHPHLELPLHAIVRLHAAALNYLVESADIASEYSIGLYATQSANYSLRGIPRCFLAISLQRLTLFSAIAFTSNVVLGVFVEYENYELKPIQKKQRSEIALPSYLDVIEVVLHSVYFL